MENTLGKKGAKRTIMENTRPAKGIKDGFIEGKGKACKLDEYVRPAGGKKYLD